MINKLLSLNGKEKDEARLLFVNVCLRKDAEGRFLPAGLASVMTYFEQEGYRFSLLDTDINSLENHEIEQYLRDNQFDCILLGSIVTHYKWVKWFVNTAKELQPQAAVIVGNSVAGSIPGVFLANAPADVVVIGEGEISAYEAVEAIRTGGNLNNVSGIAFSDSTGQTITNEPRKTGDIHSLPMVNWDYFDVAKYIEKARYFTHAEKEGDAPARPMPVITARGCVFKCTFCHYVFWNDPYRHRQADHILAEISRDIESYDANYIAFWDDLSFASAKQAEGLADAIIESGLQFRWNAAIRVDVFVRNQLSREQSTLIAQKMKDSGCVAVNFSLESGNQEIIDLMNKKIKAADFMDTVEVFRQVGIAVNTSVVFGYPVESAKTIKETFDMCYEAKVYPSIGFLLPLPATGMYDYAKQHGYITDEDAYLDSITERQDICINLTKMSDSEILGEIKVGAERLNELLQLHLDESRLIRTGRPQGDQVNLSESPPLIDPEDLKRIENDVSFNYSRAVFDGEARD